MGSSFGPPEENDEQRGADHGRDHAAGHFPLRGQDAGQKIAHHHVGATAEDTAGGQHPMIRTDDQPQQVGNHQPDKTDQPALADRGADHQRSGDQQHEGHPPDGHAHGRGQVTAHLQQVHAVGIEEDDSEAGQQYGRQHPHMSDLRRRKVTHEPEDNFVQAGVLGDGEQKHDHRGAEGIDHDAGEQQGVFDQDGTAR
ncbi:hypothetical protein DESC_320034 [Desulfosarcina cetonica]|nr:hypothetical protein DESC_320034 [Desulfosarcina cetonica]